jgi:hypothetical protein
MRWLRTRRTGLLEALVHPRFYAAQTGLDPLTGVAEVLAHFRAEGQAAGARVTALFQADHYRAVAAAAGLEVTGDPFDHWLGEGVAARIVPTPLFDEAHYRAHHPGLPRRAWGFADFVTDGCYRLDRHPTPYVQSYGARVPDRARERQDPVLLTGMLHRAGSYDLTRTSWLEEGIAAVEAKIDRLSSPDVAAMVSRAIALEPSIGETPLDLRAASWPPHLHWNSVTVAAAESVRRGLAATEADAVLFLPDDGAAEPAAEALARLRAEGLTGPVLCVLSGPGAQAPAGETVVDLRERIARLDPRQRLQVALDLVRGVGARHVLAVESYLGTRLLARYGRPLSNEMSVGGRVDGRWLDLAGLVEVQRRRDAG